MFCAISATFLRRINIKSNEAKMKNIVETLFDSKDSKDMKLFIDDVIYVLYVPSISLKALNLFSCGW